MAATGALGACCLAAVGCGGGRSGAPDPLANRTGAQVAAEALADLKAAQGVTLNDTSIASGGYVTASAAIVPGKGCTVTQIRGIGAGLPTMTYMTETYMTEGQTVYFKLDDAMWQGIAGANAAAITQSLGGRYIKVSLSDPKMQLPGVGNCAITSSQTWAGAVAKGQVTVRNGVQVLPLKNSAGAVMYVTDVSKPEIVAIDSAPAPGTTDPAGEATITVGTPVKLTPPPASQVVSGATIGL
jgi:hypothetical protein